MGCVVGTGNKCSVLLFLLRIFYFNPPPDLHPAVSKKCNSTQEAQVQNSVCNYERNTVEPP